MISPEQAAATLRDIENTHARSRELYGYRQVSPHLILWGTLWVFAYTASALLPRSAWLIWTLTIALGIAGNAIARVKTGFGITWRFCASVFVAFLFIYATYFVLPPTRPIQYGVFPPLVVATCYAIIGIWWLPRFLWLGALLFALTLCGYIWLEPWFGFWMAAVGGGSLILGGLWLGRA